MMTNVYLSPLEQSDRERFIRDNQEAFNYGAMEEFGMRDDHFEEDDQIISRETIERSIDCGEAYRIMRDGKPVGGVIIRVDGEKGDLEILFVTPKAHSKGIGYAAWCEVEKLHPEVIVWETVTPYFEKRNIHFYVNRCGFHIVEFYNSHHPDPNAPDTEREEPDDQFPDGMFRFEKRMKGPDCFLRPVVVRAEKTDLSEILDLQYLAYQSEAALFGSKDIPPLKETLSKLGNEFEKGIVLKMVDENNKIIGSVRSYSDETTAYIGKLMVHPDYQKKGYGKKLLCEIEGFYPNKRFELFTSTRSIDNIRLYEKMGYKKFKEEKITDELVFIYLEKQKVLKNGNLR